jgi:hypothetical protein
MGISRAAYPCHPERSRWASEAIPSARSWDLLSKVCHPERSMPIRFANRHTQSKDPYQLAVTMALQGILPRKMTKQTSGPSTAQTISLALTRLLRSG